MRLHPFNEITKLSKISYHKQKHKKVYTYQMPMIKRSITQIPLLHEIITYRRTHFLKSSQFLETVSWRKAALWPPFLWIVPIYEVFKIFDCKLGFLVLKCFVEFTYLVFFSILFWVVKCLLNRSINTLKWNM